MKQIGSAFVMFFGLFALYAIVYLPLTAVIYAVGRKKAGWLKREVALTFLPLLTWAVLTASNLGPTKSLANLIEVWLLAIPGSLVLLPRCFARAQTETEKLKLTLLSAIIASAIAATIYFLMPTLPE